MSERFNFTDHFNSYTLRGRANVAKATLAALGIAYVAVKMQKASVKRREAQLYCKGCQKVLLRQ
ncbi:putative 60S ribosomal protein L33 [Drosophila subobscura]|uniref:putative 60S ribosomal protein L33 n=1 Tax=Drosophila subobscura TaxID=7241 RepID=UPI00155A14FC|nr:putative 60S ribosomal protein L33 [Drosophila subobscura]